MQSQIPPKFKAKKFKRRSLRECRTYTEKSTVIPPKYKAKKFKRRSYGDAELTPKNKRCSRKINDKEISVIPKGMRSFDVAS
jgi:hypothetical protein